MSFLVAASEPPRLPTHASRVVGWSGAQGADWARRNPKTAAELDASYTERFGISRTMVNRRLLERVPRTAKVLEIGCAAGAQLDALHAIGFSDLHGVDLSTDALAGCPYPCQPADGCALPFEDGSFDLVMTSGTYMHIPPHTKQRFLDELARVASRWYYGVEMWTAQPTMWDFGSLIPPAWTGDWYEMLNLPAWPMVGRLHLEPLQPNTAQPLACYLLERG